MTNTDLIARVYPHNDTRELMKKAFTKSSYCAAPLLPLAEPEAAPLHGERELTEPPNVLDVPDFYYLPCIELT